jgi:GxxExxY protein
LTGDNEGNRESRITGGPLRSLCFLLFNAVKKGVLTGGNGDNRVEKAALCVVCFLPLKKYAAMHPLFEKASGLTEAIIGAAIEVHRDKGPGLIESIYEWCLAKELGLRGISTASQKMVIVKYKEFARQEPLRFDLLVEECVLVEAKAVQKILPIHKA